MVVRRPSGVVEHAAHGVRVAWRPRSDRRCAPRAREGARRPASRRASWRRCSPERHLRDRARQPRTPVGNASDPRGVIPTYAFYRAADDWLFVGALTEVWVKLCNAPDRPDSLAHPDLQGIPLSFAQCRPSAARSCGVPSRRISPRGRATKWLARLSEHDVPCGPVQDRRTFSATRRRSRADVDRGRGS